MLKLIYFITGFISMILGVIGVLLPILPTTPFLLLAAFCFAKSSQRFHHWFQTTKLYQKHLDSFVKERAMTLRTKVTILLFASSMLLLAIYFMEQPFLRIFLGLLLIFKYYYFIFKIRTIAPKTSMSS